jgi:hypothetical protein
VKSGKAVEVYLDGTKYEGQFNDNKRDGFGKMTWTDGTSLEINWVRGLAVGKGVYNDIQKNSI